MCIICGVLQKEKIESHHLDLLLQTHFGHLQQPGVPCQSLMSPGLWQGLQPQTLPRFLVPRAISGLLWPKHLGSALQTRCPMLSYQEMKEDIPAENVTPTFPFLIFPGKRDKIVTCWDMSDLHLLPNPVDEGEKKRSFTTQHIWKVSRAPSRHLQMSPSVTLLIRGPSSSLG